MDANVDTHLPLSESTFHILLSMAKGPQHGWGLRRDVEDRTGGSVRLGAGTLYTALQRLERDGLIVETSCPPELQDEASTRWRFYEATPFGRAVLEAETRRMRDAVDVAGRLLGMTP